MLLYFGCSEGVKWKACHLPVIYPTGYGATAHLESGGFIRSGPGVTHPDIQFHFLPSQVIDHGRIMPKLEGYQVSLKDFGFLKKYLVLLYSVMGINQTDIYINLY